MVQWFCLISWRLFDVWTSYFGIMSQYDTTFDLKLNVGHCNLYFMVQWFCLISWKQFGGWTSYFQIMSQYDPTSDLKIFLCHCDLYFIVPWDCESVTHNIWPQNKCRSLWPIFHGPVKITHVLKTIWSMNILVWDYESVWHNIWPKINVGHCNLYFMVQWFCLSWRLFDIWTSYFGIMSQ